LTGRRAPPRLGIVLRSLPVFALGVAACASSTSHDAETTGGATSGPSSGPSSVESGSSGDPSESSTGAGTGTTTGAGTSGDSSSSSGAAETSTSTGGEASAWPEPCADIYDSDILPTFELTFSDDAWQGIEADCSEGAQNYYPVEFTYDGETVAAMARLKGNWSYDCRKYQFVISFNEEDPEARFHGLRKIVLDAPWYDHTLLHERLAFPLFESLGLPYSCANNARLLVNGEYYGLYANLERLDKEYLQRHFEEADGNLYEAGYELETNEAENNTANLEALWAATTIEEVAALVDLDQAVAEWAAEAMLPAMDGYWAGVEINYFLYDHPSRGFLYLPYDLDLAFGDAAYDDGTLIWPDAVVSDPITYEHPGWQKEPLVQLVLADPTWCGRFVEELVAARAAYSPEAMAADLLLWDAQIRDALVEDPNRTFSASQHDAAVASLEDFLVARAAVVDAWLAEGDHCPASW
jgi:hypothetical protein